MVRYSIAVDRRRKDEGADYFNVVVFDKGADFAKKYFRQGMRVLIQGRLQTSSYTNRDGITVNTINVVANNQEFADGKRENQSGSTYHDDEFMTVPEGDDFGIPF